MTVDALLQAAAIVAAGLAVGWTAAISGLGAGLAMPVLAACGLSLPALLLAVKLPVTASDLASAYARHRHACRDQHCNATSSLTGWQQVAAAVSGAGAAWAVLRHTGAASDTAFPVLAMLPIFACALGSARHDGLGISRQTARVCAWSAYVGGCGIGAGLLLRLHRARSRATTPLTDNTNDWSLDMCAAANSGALLLLLATGQGVSPTIVLLATAQGVGAWLATSSGVQLGALLSRKDCRRS